MCIRFPFVRTPFPTALEILERPSQIAREVHTTSQNAQVPEVVGMTQDAAAAALKAAGFAVNPVSTKSDAPKGNVTGSAPSGLAVPGSAITIYVSDGSVLAAPPGSAAPRTSTPGG
ncbi:PASTA domain-containing protein [Prescottella equi]|uniref:PASTA domain-containing protein n=1 Tax=Rhodococcus hoagii TaxID=43767 RepID=UPI000A112E98|nr:PASTA domain-containing protein [Prescottella equi]